MRRVTMCVVACSVIAVAGIIVAAIGSSLASGPVRKSWPKPGKEKLVRVAMSPVFVDEATHIRFVVASDLRHITAFAPGGELLWNRDVTVAAWVNRAGSRATIVLLAEPLEWMARVMRQRGARGDYLAVTFDSKAFGLIDQRSGELTMLGND